MKYLFSALLLFFISSAVTVYGGESPKAGVQISPIRYDWTMRDGETKSDKIYVHNFSDVSHDVEIAVEDFYVSDDSMVASFFVPDEKHPLKAYDVINWIHAPENFVLMPGETKELDFSVTVPEGQPTNGYYGSVFFKTHADDTDVQNVGGGSVTLGVNYRVGILLTLAVQGEESMRISGSLQEFDALHRVFSDDEITLFASTNSDGNVHYKMDGKMDIYRFDKKYASIIVDPEIMYPGKTRTFTESIQTGFWDYGMYYAKMHLQSDDGTVKFDSITPSFFVIPWKSTVLIVGIIVFLIGGPWLFKKKFAIVTRASLEKSRKK